MSRRPLIAGNWKMHTSRAEAVALARAVATDLPTGVEMLVCPPFPWLVPVSDAIAGTELQLGAQDCWTEPSGAVTGAVSPTMLAELCQYVIIGHSERRRIFGETDELVARKVVAALAAGLRPIVCVGENLEVRQAGNAVPLVREQTRAWVTGLSAEQLSWCVVAYEPVWAIGTGVAAKPEDAQEMAAEIRHEIGQIAGQEIAAAMRILYGGSVSPANAAAILENADVDGALVGGASLEAEDFLAIARSAPGAGT